MPARATFTHPIPRGHAAFAYVFDGQARFVAEGGKDGPLVSHPRLVVFSDGDRVEVATHENPARFLLVSGKPLREPVARHGPFVMNTRAEIEQALRDLRQGTFVKH
jgi:redox-sensitive bicupin YhaK (pirin superfamily)